jgi:hypothetical protein
MLNIHETWIFLPNGPLKPPYPNGNHGRLRQEGRPADVCAIGANAVKSSGKQTAGQLIDSRSIAMRARPAARAPHRISGGI